MKHGVKGRERTFARITSGLIALPINRKEQETQLSLTNRATHLWNGVVATPQHKPLPHTCYHADFSQIV